MVEQGSDWGGRGLNLYLMTNNSPVNLFDFLGLKKCCIDGEQVDVDFGQVRRVRCKIFNNATKAIKSLGESKDNYNVAQWLNFGSLVQSTVGATTTVVGVSRSLIANTGKAAPKIIPSASGAGYVPLQAFDDTGRMVAPRAAARSGNYARSTRATIIGASTGSKILTKENCKMTIMRPCSALCCTLCRIRCETRCEKK